MTSPSSHGQLAEGLLFTLAGSRVPVLSYNKMLLLNTSEPQRHLCALTWGHIYNLRKAHPAWVSSGYSSCPHQADLVLGESHPNPRQDPEVHYQSGEDEVVVLSHHAHGHGLRERRGSATSGNTGAAPTSSPCQG